MAVILTIILHSSLRTELENVRREAQELEGTAPKQASLVGYTVTLLDAAATRQRESVLRSERRANALYWVSTGLMVASVLVPFALVSMYLQSDPIATAKQLLDAGIPAAEVAKAAQRDWHLLLAGVSFGLLFIAAARGILIAEARQREVYAREVRETAYYGDLVRALNIARRVDAESGDGLSKMTDDVVRKILLMLLEPNSRESLAQPPSSGDGVSPALGEHEFVKLLTEAVKR